MIDNTWCKQKYWASEKLKGVSLKNKTLQWKVVLEMQDWCFAFIKEDLEKAQKEARSCVTQIIWRERESLKKVKWDLK